MQGKVEARPCDRASGPLGYAGGITQEVLRTTLERGPPLAYPSDGGIGPRLDE